MAFVSDFIRQPTKTDSFASGTNENQIFLDPKAFRNKFNNSFYQVKQRKISDLEVFRPTRVDNKLFIGGIGNSLSEQDIIEAFRKFGKVCSFKIFVDPYTGKRRGFGFLIFQEKQSFDLAIKQKFVIVKGTSVECKASTPKQSRDLVGNMARDNNNVLANVSDDVQNRTKFIETAAFSVRQSQYFYYYGSGSTSFLKQFASTIKELSLEIPLSFKL